MVIEAGRADASAEADTALGGPVSTGRSASHEQRIEFLDALRGIAALVVAIQHSCEFLFPAYGKWSVEVIRPGEFGVILFFITSGFIIPVSIERYRSVSRFWIGRFFRLYPLYWSMLGIALILHWVGPNPFGLAADFGTHWIRNIGANLSMAQELTGHPLILGQSWTLAFELVFYLLVSLLFVGRMHDKPSPFAVGGFVAALVVGTRIPPSLLSPIDGRHVAFVVVVTVAAIGFVYWRSDRSARSLATATLLGGLAIPLFLNDPNQHMWFSLLLLSTMFTGSVLYRAVSGRLSWAHASAVVAIAVVGITACHLIWFTVDVDPVNGGHTNWHAETLTFLAAYALFGIGLALRRHRFPHVMRRLGEISYSLYLFHGIAIQVLPKTSNDYVTLVWWVGASIAVSWVTWRIIERPFQKLGRRIAKRAASTPRPLEPAPAT